MRLTQTKQIGEIVLTRTIEASEDFIRDHREWCEAWIAGRTETDVPPLTSLSA